MRSIQMRFGKRSALGILMTLVFSLIFSTAASGASLATITSFAGNSIMGYQDQLLPQAQFNQPSNAVQDSQGNIYVSDTANHLIRKVDVSGKVSTFAGEMTARDEYGQPIGGLKDGEALKSQFNQPKGLAFGADGTLYVADSGNNAIRAIAPSGVVQTVIDGLASPTGILVGQEGELYVSDTLNHRIVVWQAGEMLLIAGGGYQLVDGWLDGAFRDGQGEQAQFNEPTGLAFDLDGSILVADTANQRIRKVTLDGNVTTVAGNPTEMLEGTSYYAGGFANGQANQAQFNFPQGLVVATDGTIYVADTFNHRIRAIKAGEVSTIAGLDTHGSYDRTEITSTFNSPTDLLLQNNGELIIVDQQNHKLRSYKEYILPTNLLLTPENIEIIYNDRLLELDVNPEIKNTRTMVPMRTIADALGLELEWDQTAKTVTFISNELSVMLTIDQSEVVINEIYTTQMDVAPYIKGNRTMVPLRFISEVFNLDVNWLAKEKAVLLR